MPVNPAYGPDRLVTLATATDDDVGGSITVEFDHPVVDDPRNPFGLDFIVFGNAMQTLGGGRYWSGTEDPASVVVATDATNPERGLVEVSQDGTTWFAFAEGPWADDFAPTLSHRYDPANADASLFPGNRWWGVPADATRPIDPAIVAADFKGKSLADYARLYDGSAGGTGFDIGGFDLAPDAKGRKWIRFVRITALEPGDETEIDAVSDVSPAPSFRNWVDAHVVFEERPGFAKTNLCANGLAAFVNAALGLGPDEEPDGDFAVTSITTENGVPVLRAPLAPYASDLVRLRWSPSLATPAADWRTSLPLWTDAPAPERDTTLRVPESAAPGGAGFYRVEMHD